MDVAARSGDFPKTVGSRGTPVTVGTVVGLVATGSTTSEILEAYPYLQEQDVVQALAYAAWRVEEIEIPILA